MTCIVGLANNGTVFIGGDSAGVAGFSVTVRADAKVFRNGSMLFGFTSSFRMGQILRYRFIVPEHRSEKQTVDEYMATTFIDAVREALRAGGFARTSNGVESGGSFLVGYQGRLFEIDNDYQVGESVDGYSSVGCGFELALGAMFASEGLTPVTRLDLALRAAVYFSGGVRGPFVIETL